MKRENLKVTLLTVFVVILSAVSARGSVQQQIPAPAGSGEFGTQVAILPNGNIIVTDPLFDAPGPIANVGAVHLFNGTTLALIASLTGTNAEDRVSNFGVTVLPNGNYIVRSTMFGTNDVGAVTFCNMTTGCNFAVSAANSLVGGLTNDNVGNLDIIVLSDGDFVVRSTNWDKPSPTVSNVGAVTFCNAATGCPTGLVTDINSLIGGSASDFISNGGITVLSNGNYVVRSSNWDNPSPVLSNAGAVTFCNGTTGCTGAVSGTNSLIGTTAGDQVGSSGVNALTSGNYVVRSSQWDDNVSVVANVGAATFCSGTTGCAGTISSSNSLVGSLNGDGVGGSGLTELVNGNFVLFSSGWDLPSPLTTNVGAVTWCNGTSGCTGAVTASNSLVGSAASDQVGLLGAVALPNGNYVVRSTVWDNGAAVNAGAATLCSGTSGCTGAVSPTNSLVGASSGDNVSSGGIAFMDTSHYAVSSPNWDNGATADVGMVAYCDGTTGCIGAPDLVNSKDLVSPSTHYRYNFGSTSGDRFSSGGLRSQEYPTARDAWLANTPEADINGVTNAGICSRCNDVLGCNGAVTAADGLYGTSPNDRVGEFNYPTSDFRNYFVSSPRWNKLLAPQAGALTPCDITNPNSCKNQAVTPINSFTGNTQGDCVGGDCSTSSTCTALNNGYLACGSPSWDDGQVVDVGAVTLLNRKNNYGAGQTPSSSNSAVGTSAGDNVGEAGSITALPNGNYVVIVPLWNNGALTDAGAVVYGAGNVGTTGIISPANAVVGTGAQNPPNVVFDVLADKGILGVSFPIYNRTVVYRSEFRSILALQNQWSSTFVWNLRNVPSVIDDVIITDSTTVLLDVIPTVNSVTIEGTGNLISSGANFVDAPIQRDFTAPGTYFFPVGTKTNGDQASPVEVTVTGLAINPSTLRVEAFDFLLPGINGPESVSRLWELRETGDFIGDISFFWHFSDENGTPADYKVFKSENSDPPVQVIPFSIDIVARKATVTGVSTFSDWGIGNLVPTGAAVSVSGYVLTADGYEIRRASVTLTGAGGDERTTTTNRFGYYRFDDVPAGQIYFLTVQAKPHVFPNPTQIVFVTGDMNDINFVAAP
jgi:hypothetical protein